MIINKRFLLKTKSLTFYGRAVLRHHIAGQCRQGNGHKHHQQTGDLVFLLRTDVLCRDKCFNTSYMPSHTHTACATVSVFYLACVSHHFFVKKEPRQELGRSHRVNLLLRTAHKHSWPPGNTKIIHEAGGCMPAKTSFKEDFMLFNVTFMSVSLGM